jgi:hypothetical protein
MFAVLLEVHVSVNHGTALLTYVKVTNRVDWCKEINLVFGTTCVIYFSEIDFNVVFLNAGFN